MPLVNHSEAELQSIEPRIAHAKTSLSFPRLRRLMEHDQRYATLKRAMAEFLSAFRENNEKTEALVTTLSQLVPGFERAYDVSLKERHADSQANKDPRQSVVADQLVETVRELAEDR
jgi:hypothetical protein